MKKLLSLIILILFIQITTYSQKFEFDSYGIKNRISGNSVRFTPANLTIKKIGDDFQILAYDPRDGDLSMKVNVSYTSYDNTMAAYFYRGTVNFSGPFDYDCIIMSYLDLSEFAKGKGNDKDFIFDKYYEIHIIYDYKEVNPLDFRNTLSIFPINNVERRIAEQKKRQEEEKHQKELDEIEKQRKAKEAEEEYKRLNEFLSSRETKQYDFAEIKSSVNEEIERKIKNFLKKEITDNSTSLDFTCNISLTKDISGKQNSKANYIGLNNNNLKSKIDNYLKTIELPESTLFGTYTINTYTNYSFNCCYQVDTCRVVKNNKKVSASDTCEKLIKEIENNNYPLGKYTAIISSSTVNEYRVEKIVFKSFKGYGGSGYTLLSLIVPGVGDYFVNGGKGSMLGVNSPPIFTTIATLGMVGSGIYCKSLSNSNYDLYHEATKQSDIDKYFDLANNFNKASYILIGTGAVLWLWDVIWTAKTGSENRKASKLMKDKLSFSPVLLDNRNYGIGLTYNF
ncbi:MAG: hypothetical protein JXR36_09515 [Bacteroidales bacterium]|nr:hypothetical protein [Bacteroidales bacterium]